MNAHYSSENLHGIRAFLVLIFGSLKSTHHWFVGIQPIVAISLVSKSRHQVVVGLVKLGRHHLSTREKDYRCYDPISHLLYVSRHVTFLERLLYFQLPHLTTLVSKEDLRPNGSNLKLYP
ncbi:hypothetical protein CsSME_00006203 [Camellia sinensis var. sinensis]